MTTLTPQTLWLPIDDPVVVAVADGLGGHPAGEEASALAVRWLARAAANLSTEAAVRDALLACNEAIYADADRDPERDTMGTTIAGVAMTEQSVIVFNVGDSRVYRFDDPGLVQLSVDDNEAPARGQIRSPILTQTLGGSWDVAPIEPHLVTQPLGDAARYLICSDGLTDAITDPAITAVLRDHDGRPGGFRTVEGHDRRRRPRQRHHRAPRHRDSRFTLRPDLGHGWCMAGRNTRVLGPTGA